MEYYHLIRYIRPLILGVSTEKEFEANFKKPIEDGAAKDSPSQLVEVSLRTAERLSNMIKPYLHRKDASVLKQYLPPMQYNVIHVYPTRLQSRLYGLYKKKRQSNGFFQQLQALNPIHTHPGSLCYPTDQGKANDDAWWQSRMNKDGKDMFLDIHQGNKIVVLLHIIAHSMTVGDKVLVFANTLSILNFIEYIFSLPQWESLVPSLASKFPGKTFGGWTKGSDYERIDGSADAAQRGLLVDQFADKSQDVNVFLISKAGGIGINLVSYLLLLSGVGTDDIPWTGLCEPCGADGYPLQSNHSIAGCAPHLSLRPRKTCILLPTPCE
jgi:SNF2 family DNA or RNA helicase